jgi:hypothetical protein
MSLAAYYTSCRFSKGTPRVVVQRDRAKVADKAERECRAKVDARDGRQCFFPGCRKHASDKHHVLQRSLGGEWTTKNILSACRRHHDWFKAGLIITKGNPDRGPVKVLLTDMGRAQKIRIPGRVG